jgi:hypothetical protein
MAKSRLCRQSFACHKVQDMRPVLFFGACRTCHASLVEKTDTILRAVPACASTSPRLMWFLRGIEPSLS